jgi:hypothetical protein
MLSHLFVVFVLFLYRLNVNMNNLYTTIILLILNNNMVYLMDCGIKIYWKMSENLTLCTKSSLAYSKLLKIPVVW